MQDNPFKIGQCLITPEEFTIQLENREKQSLQPKFIEVLCYLAKNYPRIIPREELIEQIWGENSFVGDKSLTNAIWHLRKNLSQADNGNEVIETIRKAGYRLVIEPKWLENKTDNSQVSTNQANTAANKSITMKKALLAKCCSYSVDFFMLFYFR